eukprot:UN21878
MTSNFFQMFLRCLEHERMMFGMFSTCFKPLKTCRSPIFAIFVDFHSSMLKMAFSG